MPDALSSPDPPLSDGVVTLRPLRADDAPAIAAACQDPEIQRWIPIIPVPYTEADARRFILMTLQAWHDGSSYEFAIADATTDDYIGSIGLHLGPNPRRHAVGYLVAPEARGRGVAVRALRLITRWGFADLGHRTSRPLDPPGQRRLSESRRKGRLPIRGTDPKLGNGPRRPAD